MSIKNLPPGDRRHQFPRLRFKRVHELVKPARLRMGQPAAKRYGERRDRVLSAIVWNRLAVGCGPHLGVFAWGMETEFFPRRDPIELYYPQCRFLLQTAQMDQRWQSPAYRRASAVDRERRSRRGHS